MALGAGSVGRELNEDGSVDIVWPDGSQVIVRPVGRWGVAARIDLDGERAGTVSGLLGDFDGNPRNDLADRRGRRIAYTAKASTGWGPVDRYRVAEEYERRFFDDLYDKVGDAWRISQQESLLDYGRGQSTRTFTDRAIPERPVDPEAVARAKRAAAERICRARGVTLAGPLADCIVDVAATGNAAFADDALAAQESTLAAFSRLRAGSDRRSFPNLLTTADGTLHLAFEERLPGPAYRMVNVPIDAAGREGAAEVIEGVDAEPALLAGPDGGVQAVAGEIRFDATPPTGTGAFRYTRAATGAWTFQGPVTTQGTSYAGRPNALFAGDGTLLTVAPMAGVARIFRNTGDPNPGVSPTATSAPGCYATSARLARDGATGAVWMAWAQSFCAQPGIFVQQVDPATGGVLGAPLKVPGSTWTIGGENGAANPSLSDDLAFTGRPGLPGLFLAFAADANASVRLWRLGAGSSTVISRRKDGIGQVVLVPERTGGRLWLGWSESRRLSLARIGAAGTVEGATRTLAPPRGVRAGSFSYRWDLAGRDGGVDVVYGFPREDDTPGELWHARISR